MSATSIRSLLEQLTGHRVTVFFEDEEQTGRVAALTDNLVVLAVDDDVLWIDIEDITAVRVVGNNDDDDE